MTRYTQSADAQVVARARGAPTWDGPSAETVTFTFDTEHPAAVVMSFCGSITWIFDRGLLEDAFSVAYRDHGDGDIRISRTFDTYTFSLSPPGGDGKVVIPAAPVGEFLCMMRGLSPSSDVAYDVDAWLREWPESLL